MMSATSAENSPAYSSHQPLLVTKLHAPQVRPNLVPRRRLLARLDEGLGRALTVVSATAGFGKTTLLSVWREHTVARGVPVAWLSLDSEDDHPGRFWRYVFASVEAAVPGTGTVSLAMLQALQPPALPDVLAVWINELSAHNQPVVIILDDYHLITDPRIHEMMAYLLGHRPSSLHLYIASRTIPALPRARLRVRDALVEIGADDLRFTHDEAAEFFSQTMGMKLGASVIAELQHSAEGWVAAMQLSALSLRTQTEATVPSVPSDTTHLHDYLWEEIWRHLPSPVCSFLQATAILTRLSAPLCDAVTGRNDSTEILAMLERLNLFIVPLDAERRWYRIHQLFTDFLLGRLQDESSDHLQLLHRRAATWFAAQQQWGEAMSHAGQSGNHHFERALILQAAEPMLANGQAVTLSRWMDRLPAAVIDETPMILCLKVLAQLATPSSITAQFEYRHLEATEHRLLALVRDENQLSDHEWGTRFTALALLFSRQYRFNEALDYTEKAYRYREALSPVWQDALLLSMGGSRWRAGDFTSAEDTYRSIAALDGQRMNRLAAAIALANLGVMHTKQGRLQEAHEDFQRIIELAPEPQGDLLLLVSFAYQGMSTVTYLLNDLDATEHCVTESLRLGEQWAVLAAYWPNYLMQIKVDIARRNLHHLPRLLLKIERLIQPDVYWMRGYFDAFRACIDLRQGLSVTGKSWAESLGSVPELPPADYRLFLYTTYARVQAAMGKTAFAQELLKVVLQTEYVQARVTDHIQVLLIMAVVLRQHGDYEQALAALRAAVALAEPTGMIRLFLDEDVPMRAMLKQVAAASPSPFLNTLLEAFSQGARNDTNLPCPLSEQEMKVLQQIAAGNSNQQIAAALFIAASTVKTHINNLYRKLEVSSRTQALARARELHLLP